jgi:crossover junction endodeoxyribonuclease RuvC
MAKNKNFTILGIDPGYALTGYGLIKTDGAQFTHITHGVITTNAKEPFVDRLLKIKNELEKIIKKYQPQILAIENIYFYNNAKTALLVGEARGVIMLVAKMENLKIFNYTPLQVKQALVGHGRAEKKQMQKMVQIIFSLPKLPEPDDAADALAVAYCGIQTIKKLN